MTITNNMAGRLPVVAVHADRAVRCNNIKYYNI